MSHGCLHKRLGGQVGLVLETHCKKGLRVEGLGALIYGENGKENGNY